MKVYFLEAANGKSLTKKFWLDEEGKIQNESYPMVKRFTSHMAEVNTLEHFHAAVEYHAALGHCLLKGQLDRDLVNESRAGHTNPNTPTQWIVIDNDYLHHIAPDALMRLLGMGDVNYLLQWSASAGIVPGKMGYHLIVMLDREYHPQQLKELLEYWNLSIPEISQHITLTASGVYLKWPLDVSVCQNDKLIFIAPPICGPGVVDPLDGPRIVSEITKNPIAILEG